jgi:hypothetical protein
MTDKARRKGQAASGAELARLVAEFDREFVADSFGTPAPEARQSWARAKRRPGRPRKGRGAQVISVSVERALLERTDALATRMELSRAELIARGLKAVLAAEGEI